MKFRLIFRLVGTVLKYEALLMLVPLAVSLLYRDNDQPAFIAAIIITYLLGHLFTLLKPANARFTSKDGFAAVALVWIFISALGALPFYFSGYFNGYVDCLFESVSGFTSTGATILADVESLPRGILFWRCFSEWIGGMGILIFVLAIMPSMSASALFLLRAEGSGLSPDRYVPKIKETAKIMYAIYFGMTLLQIIMLLFTGLPLYDSVTTALSTAATGGFTITNDSFAAYNNAAAEWVSAVFMLLFGINFLLYYQLLRRNFKALIDDELRFFSCVVLTAVLIVAVNILPLYGNFFESLRYASFHVSSIVTTTGYYATDHNAWPAVSRAILVMMMLIGGCGGSTSGGIKMIRVLLMLKAIRTELKKIFHPQLVNTVKFNRRRIDDEHVSKIFIFFFCYLAIVAAASFLLSFENKDWATTFTAVVSSIGNVGLGEGLVGPGGSFAFFTVFSKITLIFCMLIGRLEIYPMLILFSPGFFRKDAA